MKFSKSISNKMKKKSNNVILILIQNHQKKLMFMKNLNNRNRIKRDSNCIKSIWKKVKILDV